MNFGNKGYEPVSTPALCYAYCIGSGAWILITSKHKCLVYQEF
jgi:hypothetical protein